MKPVNFIAETARIGEGTTIWHWAVILDDVVIGKNCSIGSNTEIGRGSVIGDNTRIGYGCFLPPRSIVGSNVFISPSVICCDDKFPRVGNDHYFAQPPVIEDFAAIGAGSVILPGVRIGYRAMIGAGSVITKDVEQMTIIRGEPSKNIMPVHA